MKHRGSPDRRGMGAESDFISEQFVPGERHKAQQRAMAETLAAAGWNSVQLASPSTHEEPVCGEEQQLPPQLVHDQGTERCSACQMPFAADAKPSVGDAFARHVIKVHQPTPTSKHPQSSSPTTGS